MVSDFGNKYSIVGSMLLWRGTLQLPTAYYPPPNSLPLLLENIILFHAQSKKHVLR